ncbi:muscle-specific protein 20-like [Rhopilema esculentum]|uniref:muscle-specific protein 20-like n=1 Tax=Rhopilema esculentum TaxID=499914 RepID=UPI0031DAAF8D|eukprot:gene13101-3887_t
MASRPKGFGLTRELENKKRQEYDESLAEKVCTWFNAVCQDSEDSKFAVDFEGSFTWESVHQKLKDGKLILAVANKISPVHKKKIQTLNSPFKLMENTGNFLSIADKIGVSATDLFQTSSLYEGTDMKSVINGLDAFARKTIKMKIPGVATYSGPVEAEKNQREFTEEQLKAGQNVIGLQMGTNKGANASGVSFGASRKIMDMGH